MPWGHSTPWRRTGGLHREQPAHTAETDDATLGGMRTAGAMCAIISLTNALHRALHPVNLMPEPFAPQAEDTRNHR